MDAFFAAVEQRERPELRGKPVVVGSPPDKRGVVSTASYEARAYGIHSAMPSRTAYQKCPHAVFLPVRGNLYRRVSQQIMNIFTSVTPDVEQVSVDEAFLDVASVIGIWKNAVVAARMIKQRIRDELRLTASVGVATNKFLAKLASDMDKPDGLTIVPIEQKDIVSFLEPLSVTKIWGVGAKTAERLHARGLWTIGDIQRKTESDMVRFLGNSLGAHIWNLAHGIDHRSVEPGPREEKSISHEETFPEDVPGDKIPRRTLIVLAEKVGRRLRRAQRLTNTAYIKVRFADFRTITRQITLDAPTDSEREFIQAALRLYDAVQDKDPIRLIGFGVSNLTDKDAPQQPRQLSLFDDPDEQQRKHSKALDQVVDELRAKYGQNILKRGL